MRQAGKRLAVAVIGAGAVIIVTAAAHAAVSIAGLTPDRRPEGAPVITSVVKDAKWYDTALRGISKPYPDSLKFLDNQGNWYTPFNHPGMPGFYDIRGLHGK